MSEWCRKCGKQRKANFDEIKKIWVCSKCRREIKLAHRVKIIEPIVKIEEAISQPERQGTLTPSLGGSIPSSPEKPKSGTVIEYKTKEELAELQRIINS